MKANHIESKEAVALSIRDPLLFYAAYKGCSELGIIPVVTGAMKNPQKSLRGFKCRFSAMRRIMVFVLNVMMALKRHFFQKESGLLSERQDRLLVCLNLSSGLKRESNIKVNKQSQEWALPKEILCLRLFLCGELMA